jgi:hypothetical protein
MYSVRSGRPSYSRSVDHPKPMEDPSFDVEWFLKTLRTFKLKERATDNLTK